MIRQLSQLALQVSQAAPSPPPPPLQLEGPGGGAAGAAYPSRAAEALVAWLPQEALLLRLPAPWLARSVENKMSGKRFDVSYQYALAQKGERAIYLQSCTYVRKYE